MFAYILYKIAYFLCLHVSQKTAYRVAIFFSLLKYNLSPRDRKAVVNNLKRILPPSEQDEDHIEQCAKEVFINFGKYLVDFFRFSLLKKENLDSVLKFKGLQHVDRALKKGKGLIVVTAHMGNWELGGVGMSILGYPVIAVALPHNYRKINSFFNHQREKRGVVVVPSLGLAIRRIYEALKNNKLVALVGDRDFTSAGQKMDFLGATKIIPRGPAVLALRTGAPIVPAFVIRQKDDTHVVEFEEPIQDLSSEERIMSQCVKLIEAKIRQYPCQWLMFREFWKE